jgi:hypothetical protein
LLQYQAWQAQPVYIVSPTSQATIGVLPPPNPEIGIAPETQMQLSVLNSMANPAQDPNRFDPQAGLYAAPYNGNQIDGSNPGAKISGAYAYNLLRQGQGVFFHPPDGAFEKLNDLGDLDAYLYVQQQAAPPGTQVLPQE